MTLEDLELLCDGEVRDLIDKSIERDYRAVALDKSLIVRGLNVAALVAEQVKYLQRARRKLPSYYAARCVVVGRSYEQSSSEAIAALKVGQNGLQGHSALDLTCGLGVDTMALAVAFERVVTIERDAVFAAVARENFRRLGVHNIEVVNSSAEEYLAALDASEAHFDLVYCDPDRRSADGKKRVLLEDCSPDIMALQGTLERITDQVVVKCSPLFDVAEAFRIFGPERTSVEVLSSGDECKEVLIYSGKGVQRKGYIGATALNIGSKWLLYCEKGGLKGENEQLKVQKGPLKVQNGGLKIYNYLIVPDVALQKGRVARRVLSEVCDIWSDNGFGFATEHPTERQKEGETETLLGRIYEIRQMERYEPKKVKRMLKELGVERAEILKRDFPYGAEQVAKQLGLKGGGAAKIAVTKVQEELYVILLGDQQL